MTVSPTYVPDLVNTCLDLLIDRECGIWHLTNGAAMSWADLARRACAAAGIDAGGLEERSAAELGMRPPRPLDSAMSSERGMLLPAFDDALARYLRNAKGRRPLRMPASGALTPADPERRNYNSRGRQGPGWQGLYASCITRYLLQEFLRYTTLHSVTLRNLVHRGHMKLYRGEQGWAERLIATADSSITLDSAVPPHLSRLPLLRERARSACAPCCIRCRPRLAAPAEFPSGVFGIRAQLPALPVQGLPAVQQPRPGSGPAPGGDPAHYLFMFRRGLGQTMARASLGPVVLAEACGKSGLPYEIQLRTVNMFDREGELVLQLAQAGKIIFTVAFTVAPRDGRPALNIGCIQGGKTEDAREAIRLATRDLHGMRPKQLMVSAGAPARPRIRLRAPAWCRTATA
jgi:hypothetical protein